MSDHETHDDTTTEDHSGCEACTETTACHKHTEWCDPTTIDLGDHVIGESEPCPEEPKEPVEVCVCHTAKQCPVHLKLKMTFKSKGCDPHPCIASIPPNLGCVPIRAGTNSWDGGVPKWMNACLKGCDLDVAMAKDPYFEKFITAQGQSLLDLSTNPEHTTNLHVIGTDYVPRQINLREFYALAVKMYEVGMQVSGGVNPNNISLNMVQAEDGSMMIAATHQGVAIGTGIAIVELFDSTGASIGYGFPPPAP